MNDTQKKLYELLIKFDELCQKHGVVYYLGGGSALGALRHKGFLPWDDDVDLYITRKNYEKLLSVEDEFFSDDFKLVNTNNYPKYRNTIVRCADTGSTVITKARIADKSPRGQFVELFIMDPMPADKDKQYDWFVKHWIYAELLSTTYRVANPRINDYTDKALYMEYKSRCEREGYDKILSELENELFTIDEKDAVQFCSRWGLRNLIYDIEWMQEPRYVPFEDTMLPVATYAENVARFDYGDSWMYIPNVNNQVTHSFADSMTLPYQEIVDDYTNFINEDEVYELYYDRKKCLMDSYFLNKEASLERIKLKQAQINCAISRNMRLNPDIKKDYENADVDSILAFFKTWYDIQFSKSYWERGIYLPIGDELLNIALVPIIIGGGYSKAIKVLSFRKKQGELSPQLKLTSDFVNAVREVYIAIDNHDHLLARKRLEQAKEIGYKFTDKQFNIRILELKYALDDADNDKDIKDILHALTAFLEEYEINPEIMLLIGEAYYRLKDYENAQGWYNKSLELTRHGFIIIHIQSRLDEIRGGNLS